MSNNNDNKKPLDLTESLLLFDKAQAPSTTTVNVGDVELGIPEINRVAAAPQNLVQSAEASTTTPTVNELDYDGISLVERRSRDVRQWEKNDILGISGINQPDVTTRNLSRSDELTIGFLLDCAKRGQNRGNKRQPSICKVSRMLRDHSESSYEPQLVSIGPIHKEDPKLQEFEWQKESYLGDLLSRCLDSTPKETLAACLLKVNTLIPRIRESYAGVKKNYSDVELARMMVMDGCFILEFCFKDSEENFPLSNGMQNYRIAMDLMLLENQVPFVVLQALFDCLAPYIFKKKGSVTLSQVLDTHLAPYITLFRRSAEKNSIHSNVLDKYLAPYIKLFCSLLREKISNTDVDSDLPEKISTTDVDSYLPEKISTPDVDSYLPEKISTTDVDSDSTPAHVLGYMYKRYHLVGAKPSTIPASHSIVELDRSGMKFKPHQECVWSMSIKFQSSLFACLPWFWSKPTLLMPTLVIDDTTDLILRNFIAYEQSFPQDHYYFTSYTIAMDKLIDTKEDIAKLVESKVLDNTLGSNQEAADLINKLCKNVYDKGFYYTQEFKQMDKYYNSFWPKHIARLRRVYFSNPWSIIALVAAIILFGLTVVQTIFTIKAA